MNRYLSLLFLCMPILLLAQRNDPHRAVAPDFYPGEAVATYDLRASKKIDRLFFYEEWLSAQPTFLDTEKVSKSIPLKYDILNQELNVFVDGEIFVLPHHLIDGFILSDVLGQQLYSFKVYNGGKHQKGIYEILEEGAYTLLAEHYAQVRKSNYQPALDAGSKNESAVRKSRYFLLDKEGKLHKIPSKKKEVMSFFNQYKAGKKFLNINKINHKDSENLGQLIKFMNDSSTK